MASFDPNDSKHVKQIPIHKEPNAPKGKLPRRDRTKEEHAEIERALQKWFVPQFPKGFLPTMGERLAFMAGRDSKDSELSAMVREARADSVALQNALLWVYDACFLRDVFTDKGTEYWNKNIQPLLSPEAIEAREATPPRLEAGASFSGEGEE